MNNIFLTKKQQESCLIKKNNNSIKQISIFSTIFVLIFFSFSTFSLATWEDPRLTDFWNPLAYVVYMCYNLVFSGDMFSGQIFGYDVFGNGIMGNLIFDTTNSNMASGIWGFIEGAYSFIQPVGIMLVILYFLLSLIEKVQMDNFNIEHLIKSFIKLTIAILLIANGLRLLRETLNFTNALYFSIETAISGDSEEGVVGMGGLLEQIFNACKTMGILEAIGTLILMIPMIICNLLAIGAMYIISFSRLMQLGIYGVFAPIGMANIYEGGLNSSGFRYFKKFLAVGIQGVIIFVIVQTMNQISASLLNGNGAFNAIATLFTSSVAIIIPLAISLLVNLIICFTAIALMFKSMSFANDIVGV